MTRNSLRCIPGGENGGKSIHSIIPDISTFARMGQIRVLDDDSVDKVSAPYIISSILSRYVHSQI